MSRDDYDRPRTPDRTPWIILGVVLGVLVVCGGIIALAVGGMFWVGRQVRGQMERAVEQQQQMMEQMSQQQAQFEAEAFLELIKGGNELGAYEQHTTRGFRSRHSREQFRALIAKHALLKSYLDHSATVKKAEPGKVTLSVKLTGPQGELTLTLRLIQEDGFWRVDEFTAP